MSIDMASQGSATGRQSRWLGGGLRGSVLAVMLATAGPAFSQTSYFEANSTNAAPTASGRESVAIGPSATASGDLSIAQGSLAKAEASNSIAIGSLSRASGTFAVALGQGAKAEQMQATAIGQGARVTGELATALGTQSLAEGQRSIAAGSFAKASGQNTSAFGDFATATGALGTALGVSSQALAQQSTAVGAGATVTQTFGTALGNMAAVSSIGGVAIGSGAVVNQDNSVAIGRWSSTLSDLTLAAYNPFAGANIAATRPIGEFSIGAQGQERRITNVAAGAADTDAVNVSQLKAAMKAVDASGGGGGSPAGAVKYDTNPDGSVNHQSVTLQGDGGTQITNVAPGAVSATSTDAVNGSQLYAVDQRVTNLENKLGDIRRDAYAGTATAVAMASLPQSVLAGKSLLAIGGGTYGGESAMALGVSALSDSGRWVYRANASANTRGNVAVGVGAGFHW